MIFYEYEDIEDSFDRSLRYGDEYDSRYEGLTMDEIADLESDEANKEAYVSMMLDSYNW